MQAGSQSKIEHNKLVLLTSCCRKTKHRDWYDKQECPNNILEANSQNTEWLYMYNDKLKPNEQNTK